MSARLLPAERRQAEREAWSLFFRDLDPREAVIYADVLDQEYVGDPVAAVLAARLRAGK